MQPVSTKSLVFCRKIKNIFKKDLHNFQDRPIFVSSSDIKQIVNGQASEKRNLTIKLLKKIYLQTSL